MKGQCIGSVKRFQDSFEVSVMALWVLKHNPTVLQLMHPTEPLPAIVLQAEGWS